MHVNTWAICWGKDNSVLVVCSVQHWPKPSQRHGAEVERSGSPTVTVCVCVFGDTFFSFVFVHLLSKFETFIRFQLPFGPPLRSSAIQVQVLLLCVLYECLNFMRLCSIFKFYLFHLSRWIFGAHNSVSNSASSSSWTDFMPDTLQMRD